MPDIAVKQQRENYMDALAGILIIHMEMGHAIQWAHLTETDSAYLFFQKMLGFFMLWFCFKAGMFFKPKSMLQLIKSSVHRLLVPFVIFSAIGYLTWSGKIFIEGEMNWKQYVYTPVKQLLMGGGIGGNLPLWYLLTLFVARIVFNWMASRRWFYLLIPVALIPWAVHWSEMELPLYFSNISMAILFMGLGNLLKPHLQNRFVITASVVAYLAFLLLIPTYVDMRYNTLLYGNYYLWYIIALSGIITFTTLFRLIPYKMLVLTYIGKNSMAFFCIHWIVFTVCRIVFLLFGWDYLSYPFVITIITASFVLIPLCNETLSRHHQSWLIGGMDIKK